MHFEHKETIWNEFDELTFTLFHLNIITSEAFDCEADSDCDGDGEKICHESKCICGRAKPIEAGGNCLSRKYHTMDLSRLSHLKLIEMPSLH